MSKSNFLRDISPYVYGTTRLGDASIPIDDRINIALSAMQSVEWFHTSHMYDDALTILGEAFKREPANVPKLIIKVGWDSVDEIRDTIKKNLEPLGVTKLDIGQLCFNDELANQFASGGDIYKGLQQLKEEGIVDRFVYEVFPWTSEAPLKALKGGYPEGIVDGYIFYFNPLQRFASNELWDLIHEKKESIIAMRTVSGGPVHRLRDVPGAAWKDYLQKRAVEVAPIFERSGIKSWTEFCIRFAFSFPLVRATVGSTSRLENLNEFIYAKNNIQPLDIDIVNDITKLQYRWSDELDIKAEPWSM